MSRKTTVSIERDMFYINGRPTYPGRYWKGLKIEGLLMNSRMVQATFDDKNPDTRHQWAYSDTGVWDPDRNAREFVEQLPVYRRHGLLAATVNFQGGNPRGYGKDHPWINTAFEPDGSLDAAYLARMEKIIERADELGMAVILGYYYFGQDKRLTDDEAIQRGAINATDWVCRKGFTNVLIETNNEANVGYAQHPILKPQRVDEIIRLVQQRSTGKLSTPAGRLLASTSLGGGHVPEDNIVAAADFLLVHGNSQTPDKIHRLVRKSRQQPGYRGQPVVNNEDDHFDFDQDTCNFIASLEEYCSWGYFDYRVEGDGPSDGYQSVPVDWTINAPRKKAFFELLAKVTGSDGRA